MKKDQFERLIESAKQAVKHAERMIGDGPDNNASRPKDSPDDFLTAEDIIDIKSRKSREKGRGVGPMGNSQS